MYFFLLLTEPHFLNVTARVQTQSLVTVRPSLRSFCMITHHVIIRYSLGVCANNHYVSAYRVSMSPTVPPINSTPFSSIPKHYCGQSYSPSYDTLQHLVNNPHTTLIVDQYILHTPCERHAICTLQQKLGFRLSIPVTLSLAIRQSKYTFHITSVPHC